MPHSGNIARFTLDNGIALHVYENFASPAVIISGYLQAGACDVPAQGTGLAGFATDCLTRGTRSHSYQKIFEMTESVGASLSLSSGIFTTGLFAKGLAEDLPMLLGLLSSVLREPVFPADEIERERSEWVTGLQERANSTSAVASLSFYAQAYPKDHPFHSPTDGTLDSLAAHTCDDLVAYHETYFAPRGMTLVLVGAIRAEEARARVEEAFGAWQRARPARAALVDSLPAPRTAPTRIHHTLAGKSQTALLLGYPALAHNDPDWLSAVLMNSILGQFGMYGRLGHSVRKQEGLVYYIGSRFDGGMIRGPWTISAGANPAGVARVVEIARGEMRKMRDRKVTAGELDDNQRYFTGTQPLQMETNEGIAGQIINMIRYNRGLDYLLTLPERVNAVTTSDIQRVARRWLDPDNYVLVTCGPQ